MFRRAVAEGGRFYSPTQAHGTGGGSLTQPGPAGLLARTPPLSTQHDSPIDRHQADLSVAVSGRVGVLSTVCGDLCQFVSPGDQGVRLPLVILNAKVIPTSQASSGLVPGPGADAMVGRGGK